MPTTISGITVLIIIIFRLMIAPHPAGASQYSYMSIMPPGWSWSYAHGTNDSGDVVGYGGAGSFNKGFLYRDGIFTELLPPGWSSAAALTINKNGKIVGYGTVDGVDRAFTYFNGSYNEVLPPGWSWVWGIRINDKGDVVGGGYNGTDSRGFLYTNGSYAELTPPGWSVSTAYGINNSGVIVGWGTDGTGIDKGYMYVNGEYTELLPPGWISATAYNINDSGEVIGEGTDGSGQEKGYLFRNGQFVELLPPGWLDVVPEDINESGVVAGYGTDGNAVKGFVYSDGTYIVLTSPVRTNTAIIGINNYSEAVGLAYNPASGFISELCPHLAVRNPDSSPAYYSTLQEAYGHAVDGNIIQVHNVILTGALYLDLDKSVTIVGGYDCEHTEVNGVTRLNADVIISRGTTTIENVVLE